MQTTPVEAGPEASAQPQPASSIETRPWVAHAEWGPRHMLNDMGPATVVLSAEDVRREAASLIVHHAVARAIGKGEEYEYDE